MTAAMPIVILMTVNMLRILFLGRATKGTGFLYIRDEVSDRIWNTLAGKGWHDPELRAQGFQQFGTSSVACLWGFRAAIQFANQIGVDSIERRHRQLAGYMLGEIAKRGIESWTSPNPIMRCAIVTVNVPPIQRMQLEDWMWKKSPCLCIRFFPMLWFRRNQHKCFGKNGGDDETRTRDLCRDRTIDIKRCRRTSFDTTRYRMSLLIVPLLYPDLAELLNFSDPISA